MTATITISGNNYVVYESNANADVYWAAMLGATATAWTAATDATQDKALVQATRLIDRVAWQGTPVGTPQIDVVLQWPRTGVVRADGTVVDDSTVPYEIVTAFYEIAGALIVDPTLFTQVTSGSNIRRVSPGGGVEVEFFNPTLGITGRFPVNIQELIGQFLSGSASGSVSGSFSSGTGATQDSIFGDTPNESNYDISRGL